MTISADMPGGEPAADILGPHWRRAQTAHMVTDNGVGVELFEFTEPAAERRADNFDYWRTGIFYMSITCPDVTGTVERITRLGGKARLASR